MIMVYAQWQSEIMTVLQGDFEEEPRGVSVDRAFDRPNLRDRPTPYGATLSFPLGSPKELWLRFRVGTRRVPAAAEDQ